jgi:hypothetical protein
MTIIIGRLKVSHSCSHFLGDAEVDKLTARLVHRNFAKLEHFRGLDMACELRGFWTFYFCQRTSQSTTPQTKYDASDLIIGRYCHAVDILSLLLTRRRDLT